MGGHIIGETHLRYYCTLQMFCLHSKAQDCGGNNLYKYAKKFCIELFMKNIHEQIQLCLNKLLLILFTTSVAFNFGEL